MATSITKFENAFKYRLVEETNCTNTAVVNVTSEPGAIHSISLDNTGSSSAAYFKFFDAASVTMGTTVADMVLKVKASSRYDFEIPTGLTFTYVSFACTANQDPEDNTAPQLGVGVKLIVS